MIIRPLRGADIQLAKDIAMSKFKVSGTAPPSPQALNDFLSAILNPTRRIQFYGLFEDDKLISWIAFKFGELHGEPIWAILNIYSSVSGVFSFNRSDIKPLIRKAFTMAEGAGYFTYIYTISKRLESVYERRWKKNDWIKVGRYELHTIAEVKANSEAPEAWMSRLIGGVKPHDVVIKKRILKPEFRNDLHTEDI